jgi:glycosyltransferase involved in cell wall biosynthesis
VEAAYADCSLVAVPSISEHGGPESFGRTVIEAWAHAKPVVAFACGGPGYLIRDGVDGFLVPEKNVDLLAERIRTLAIEPARREAMGQAGLRRATSDFSVASVAGALIHTLNGLNAERALHAGREEGLA